VPTYAKETTAPLSLPNVNTNKKPFKPTPKPAPVLKNQLNKTDQEDKADKDYKLSVNALNVTESHETPPPVKKSADKAAKSTEKTVVPPKKKTATKTEATPEKSLEKPNETVLKEIVAEAKTVKGLCSTLVKRFGKQQAEQIQERAVRQFENAKAEKKATAKPPAPPAPKKQKPEPPPQELKVPNEANKRELLVNSPSLKSLRAATLKAFGNEKGLAVYEELKQRFDAVKIEMRLKGKK
jgi:hypothetical protein